MPRFSTGSRRERPRWFSALQRHERLARFGAAAAPAIRRAARKLSRAGRGSKRREKTKRQLLRQRRKLAKYRKTYLHQVNASLARRFGAIAVEDLSVANMTRSAK